MIWLRCRILFDTCFNPELLKTFSAFVYLGLRRFCQKKHEPHHQRNKEEEEEGKKNHYKDNTVISLSESLVIPLTASNF